jgi:hypothetical protein
MRRATRPACAALALLALAVAGCGGGAKAVTRSPFFGVNVSSLWQYGPPALWPANAQAIGADGFGVARATANWEVIEPTPPTAGGRHTYDWTATDALVAALAKAGVRYEPLLAYAPGWARKVPQLRFSPPRDPEQFATYAAALTSRYAAGGVFWKGNPKLKPVPVDTVEIWNEENAPYFWPPLQQPAAYADLYLSARRRINRVAPTVRVLIGGLVGPTQFPLSGAKPGAINFVRAMLDARPDLAGQIDGIAYHPYAVNPQQVMTMISQARRGLTELGEDTTPLFITEVGWSTAGPTAIDEARRAGYVAKLADLMAHSGCGVAQMLVHDWSTRRVGTDREDFFGLYTYGLSPQPLATGAAYAAAVRNLASTAPSDGHGRTGSCP